MLEAQETCVNHRECERPDLFPATPLVEAKTIILSLTATEGVNTQKEKKRDVAFTSGREESVPYVCQFLEKSV